MQLRSNMWATLAPRPLWLELPDFFKKDMKSSFFFDSSLFMVILGSTFLTRENRVAQRKYRCGSYLHFLLSGTLVRITGFRPSSAPHAPLLRDPFFYSVLFLTGSKLTTGTMTMLPCSV